MIRKFLTVAGTAALTALVIPGTASADELTTLTATVTPETGEPGDIVTATVTITNEHDRKITYEPLATPAMFAECGVDIGTLVPGQTATVECDGTLPEAEDLAEAALVFSIRNAESEHNDTYAEALVDIGYTPTTPSEAPPIPEQGPTLPITGTPIATIALAGTGAIAVGVIALRLARRQHHPARDL